MYAHQFRLIEVCWFDSNHGRIGVQADRKYTDNNPSASKDAARLRWLLEKHLPESMLAVELDHYVFDDLELPDRDDEHVLVAAMAGEVDIICTDDKDGFSAEAVERTGAEVWLLEEVLTRIIQEFRSELALVHQKVVSMNPNLRQMQTIAKLDAAKCPNAARGASMISLPGGSHRVAQHEKPGRGVWGGHWRRNPSR